MNGHDKMYGLERDRMKHNQNEDGKDANLNFPNITQ